jgi:hypothetical protein
MGLRYCTTWCVTCATGADCNTSHNKARCNIPVISSAGLDTACACKTEKLSRLRLGFMALNGDRARHEAVRIAAARIRLALVLLFAIDVPPAPVFTRKAADLMQAYTAATIAAACHKLHHARITGGLRMPHL